ncbi:helix-turn-helix domain-containing protein [Nitrobacteraceae bacterium UC4446_H13]
MSSNIQTTGQDSGHLVTSHEVIINGFEQLRAATPSTKSEIIQLEAGRMQGRLKHAIVSELSLGFGTFSRGILSRGVFSDERVTIGFVFDRESQSRSIETMRISLPGVERERRYAIGVTSFGGISVSVEDFIGFFGPNSRFGELSIWKKNNSFRADHETGAAAAETLHTIMSSFDRGTIRLSQAEAMFWKRAILEAATSVMMIPEPFDTFVSSPKRLVRKAQEYIDGSGSSPVHMSELLSTLRVSRRTLHRVFDEVLGIPPMTYLRYRRLCEARILLKEGAGQDITIADVAFKKGFSDFGRFSGYYRSLFGENPSDTLRSARPNIA